MMYNIINLTFHKLYLNEYAGFYKKISVPTTFVC